jgi:hypothetical protein
MIDEEIFPDQILTDLEYPIRTLSLFFLLLKLRGNGYQLAYRRNRDCLFIRSAILKDAKSYE